MRISNQLIKCVGFVSRDTEELEYRGTAFVVGVPYDAQSGRLHLVTAKHVAVAMAPNECVIAMNGKDGLPLFIKGQDTPWFYHPTESDSVDVAVMPFASARIREYDLQHIPVAMFATDERIAEYGVGIGDEIINIGLFTPFFGTSHLIPIVRTGNIAMMPRDNVPTKMFGNVEAYLAEGRSIGGLSGSPVFVRSTVNMPAVDERGEPVQISGLGPLLFLGLMNGHWDLQTRFSDGSKSESVNMGVSIIIPAKKILEVLYHPDLVKLRQEAFERKQ